MNTSTKTVEITPEVVVGGGRPFALIAGPCVIEPGDVLTVEDHGCLVIDVAKGVA
jgi:3-deoxy-D-manno-octulosonic acid (KDO) 8-phosphate synthase